MGRTVPTMLPQSKSGVMRPDLAAIILAVSLPHSSGNNSIPSFLSAASAASRIAARTRLCTALSLSFVIALSRSVGIDLSPYRRPRSSSYRVHPLFTDHLVGIPVVRVLNAPRDPQFRLLLLLADSLFGRLFGGLSLSGLSHRRLLCLRPDR